MTHSTLDYYHQSKPGIPSKIGCLTLFMPGGVPRYVRCYDNGGRSADRYTVCFTGRAASIREPGRETEYPYLGMSADPFYPLGFAQHGLSKGRPCDGAGVPIGRKCHLGTRIAFADLPDDCRKLVLRDYREIWNLN